MRDFLPDLGRLFTSCAAPYRQFWRWNGLKLACAAWALFAGSALALPALLALAPVAADVSAPLLGVGLDEFSTGKDAASALGGAIAEAGVGKFAFASACVAWAISSFALAFSYAFGSVFAHNMSRALRGEGILVFGGNPWLDARRFARFAAGIACMAPFGLAVALAWALADLALAWALGGGSFYENAVSPLLAAAAAAFAAVRLGTWGIALQEGPSTGGKSAWRLVWEGWKLPRGAVLRSTAAWLCFSAAYASVLGASRTHWAANLVFLAAGFGLWETGLAALRERLSERNPAAREPGRDL